ncbi:hypothetical protein [Bdellovibrio svalbardensis]|uniref:Uncharacterized protein n=1 Tax=Bdellovibrio svalbardensis TaxID=2972972 RepID=A0ABT6DF22_9BACT|nr:hypothetical protein [Bdellovibrio svalbardensis]MDG0815441.1 hypothetical protein [Bdellovibrio svalbardensis]
MKKLIQLITVAMGVFMILKGAYAADGTYSMRFKEVGLEQLSTDLIIHDRDGEPESKEVKVGWTEDLKIVKSHCKVSGLLAMDDVTGQIQKDMQAQANLLWSF